MLIRKYPNRRLYNTASRTYVNLEDLAALIRQGQDLQVVDAKTGEDVTRVVLTQIIVEEARETPAGLPLELLRQLILASDRAGKEFLNAALSPIHMVRGLFAAPAPNVVEQELEQLRRRVAELEQRLEKPRSRRKR